MGFSDYRKNLWLSEFDQIWLALHFDNPETAGAYASEVFGGSYGRVEVSLSDPSTGVVFVITDAIFTGLPTTKITHVAGWDSQVNGNLEFSTKLPVISRVSAGQNFTVIANSIALSFNDVTDPSVT